MSLSGNAGSNAGVGGTGGGGFNPGLSLNTGASDPNAKRKSIFEPSATAAGGSSSLLGATTSAPSLSLSGATLIPGNTNAPTTSAPTFGFGATTTTTSAPSGGLLGMAPSQPATTGLFGNPGTSTTAVPSLNLLGNPGGTSNPSQPPSYLSIFGPSTAPAPQQNLQQSQDALPQPPNRESAYFSSLLERQKKKARLSINGGNRLDQLPSVNMDLGDLARKASEIGGRTRPTGTAASDSRAHYLLAGSGVAPGQAYRDFQALDGTSANLDRTTRQGMVDEREAYLKGLQAKGREAMMRESMERVYREVDAHIEQSLGISFEEQKKRIMEHFGLIAPRNGSPSATAAAKTSFAKTRSLRRSEAGTRSVFGRSAIDKSMIGSPGNDMGTTAFFGGGSTTGMPSLGKNQTIRDLRDKERLYMQQVEALNQARLEEKTFPVMQRFEHIERSVGGDAPKQVADAFKALAEITHESDPKTNVRERQYAAEYVNASSSGEQGMKLRQQILDRSRVYLEKSFYRDLESIVERNPREAQLGGRPTATNKVRAYIRVRAARHDLAPDGAELQQIGEDGDYCWILIFYLLRAGLVKEAAEYVETDTAFQSTDRRFVSYLVAYANSADRRLSRKLQEMIDGEYQQRAKIAPKGTVDPYRLACYKVIGRCDLGSRNLDSVGQGVEDWIWLQFVLAREVARLEELSGEVFGLEQICETVQEIGQKHFAKGQVEGSNAYGTYLLMQILAGLFEGAVDYLHSFNPVSAVHLAIALSYYGLLRVADHTAAGNDLLTFSTTQQPQINVVPLVALYTTAFRAALPVAAVDYVALICLHSDLKPASLGQAFTNACHEVLRELCLETREFAALLGDIRSDGVRIPGAIERRATLIHIATREDFLKSITGQAAAVADQRGQIADAVLLYHLCEDYDNVVNVLIRVLADAVSIDLGESPLSLQPLRPRTQPSSTSGSSSGMEGPSSLSLTQSSSSPVDLARNMMQLYDSNASYFGRISAPNRETCQVLLRLLSVRAKLESQPPQWMSALEELNQIAVLPLAARGQISTIRQAAQTFSALPQVLARSVGLSILWAVRAIGGERDKIAREGSWDPGNGRDADSVREQLSGMARDLMVFAGLVKYKLPSRVYDLLTRAGGDVGGF